jgi:uncharacterized protein YjdB
VVACGAEPINPDRCTIRLAVISPDPALLQVGEAVTLEAQLTEASSCLPPDAQPRNFRWQSDNPGVATVDAGTGRVSAVQNGSAQVTLLTAATHTVLTQSAVVVGAQTARGR